MNILLVEPYYTGSHKSWAQGYQSFSNHNVQIISLPGQFWKWRMHGGAITLAKQFMDCLLYTSPSPRDKRQARMPSSA